MLPPGEPAWPDAIRAVRWPDEALWLHGSVHFIGLGTVVNVTTIVIGSLLGIAIGERLSQRTAGTVTDVLGLFTMVIGALSVAPVTGQVLADAVPGGAASIVVLLSLLLGAITGSALRVEDRMNGLGEWVRGRWGGRGDSRFVDGFVTASLVFCVGPLSILGSISDGLGRGADQLLVKSVLDGFASIAFASSLGIGVLGSAVLVLLYQGLLTIAGHFLGDIMSPAQIDALSVTGGIILIGLGIRLAGIKAIRVGDLLPALVFAPVLVLVAGLVG